MNPPERAGAAGRDTNAKEIGLQRTQFPEAPRWVIQGVAHPEVY